MKPFGSPGATAAQSDTKEKHGEGRSKRDETTRGEGRGNVHTYVKTYMMILLTTGEAKLMGKYSSTILQDFCVHRTRIDHIGLGKGEGKTTHPARGC